LDRLLCRRAARTVVPKRRSHWLSHRTSYFFVAFLLTTRQAGVATGHSPQVSNAVAESERRPIRLLQIRTLWVNNRCRQSTTINHWKHRMGKLDGKAGDTVAHKGLVVSSG
jgi:hypothetical protein